MTSHASLNERVSLDNATTEGTPSLTLVDRARFDFSAAFPTGLERLSKLMLVSRDTHLVFESFAALLGRVIVPDWNDGGKWAELHRVRAQRLSLTGDRTSVQAEGETRG